MVHIVKAYKVKLQRPGSLTQTVLKVKENTAMVNSVLDSEECFPSDLSMPGRVIFSLKGLEMNVKFDASCNEKPQRCSPADVPPGICLQVLLLSIDLLECLGYGRDKVEASGGCS